MTQRATDRLLVDIGSAIDRALQACSHTVCKVLVSHAGAGELECCDCDGCDCVQVTVWEDRSYLSVQPPFPVDPDPGASSWVEVHQIMFTVATCWPQYATEVPIENDDRQGTALKLAKIRDCIFDWLSSCQRNMTNLDAEVPLKVWVRGVTAEKATNSEAGIECRGWEWSIALW